MWTTTPHSVLPNDETKIEDAVKTLLQQLKGSSLKAKPDKCHLRVNNNKESF